MRRASIAYMYQHSIGLVAPFACILTIVLIAGCGSSAKKAEEKILELGISYSPEHFVQAAFDNELETVKLFVRSGMNIDTKATFFLFQATPLEAACDSGHTEIVEYLLDEGADRGDCADLALASGNLNIFLLLLDRGAPVEAADMNSALNTAASQGAIDILRELLQKGAHSNTALANAARRSHLAAVEVLLDAGLHSEDALVHAAEIGNLEILKLLLESGTRFQAKTIENAFNSAVRAGNADTVELLFDKGLTVGSPMLVRLTLRAIDRGNVDVADLLIESHVAMTVDEVGQVLLGACEEGNESQVRKLLIKAGRVAEETLVACFMQAMDSQFPATLQLMIDTGVEINVRTVEQKFKVAARDGHLTIVNVVLASDIGLSTGALNDAIIEASGLRWNTPQPAVVDSILRLEGSRIDSETINRSFRSFSHNNNLDGMKVVIATGKVSLEQINNAMLNASKNDDPATIRFFAGAVDFETSFLHECMIASARDGNGKLVAVWFDDVGVKLDWDRVRDLFGADYILVMLDAIHKAGVDSEVIVHNIEAVDCEQYRNPKNCEERKQELVESFDFE